MAWSMRAMWAGSSSIGLVLKSIIPAFPPGNRDVGMHRDAPALDGLPQRRVLTHLLVKVRVLSQAIPPRRQPNPAQPWPRRPHRSRSWHSCRPCTPPRATPQADTQSHPRDQHQCPDHPRPRPDPRGTRNTGRATANVSRETCDRHPGLVAPCGQESGTLYLYA
mgnify:CR=1 FL=1